MSQHLICSKERGSLDLTDADGVWALFTFTDFECDGVTVGDFSGHFGDVNEEIIATFYLNKSISFYLVKPLDSSLRHGVMPVLQVLEVKGWEDQSKPVVWDLHAEAKPFDWALERINRLKSGGIKAAQNIT